MSEHDDIFGRDIILGQDERLVAAVAANGELILADGASSAVQDIMLRLFTRLGGLFYDRDFGSLLPDFIHDDNTPENRLALRTEVIRRVELDARVLAGSVDCKILAWDEKKIQLEVFWVFWETDEPQNVTLALDRPAAARALEDVAL